MEVYRSFDDGLGAAWSLADLDTRGFEEVADAIVVSGEEKTIDKGELCRRPLISSTIFFERTSQMSEVSVGRQSQ